ncbi:MAG: hypothetical protein V2G33_06995 [bacterium JZ-2024 1]
MNIALITSFSYLFVEERKVLERKKFGVSAENFVHLNGEDVQPETINSLCSGSGLFVSAQSLWIEISSAFSLSRRKKEERQALRETCAHHGKHHYFRFYDQLPRDLLPSISSKFSAGIPPVLSPLFQFFTELQSSTPCKIEIIPLPETKDLIRYILKRSHQKGIPLDTQTAYELSEKVGSHPDDIENSLNLLKLSGGRTLQELKHTIPFLPENMETAIHYATRNLWKKKMDKALQHLELLQRAGADPKRIIAYLESDVRREISSAGNTFFTRHAQDILAILHRCDLRMVVTDENPFHLLREAFYRIYEILREGEKNVYRGFGTQRKSG